MTKGSAETKWTGGPWTMDRRDECLVGADGKKVVVWGSGLSFGQRSEETEANARLIAASPALYEALKLAAPALNFGPIHTAVLEAIRLAEEGQ